MAADSVTCVRLLLDLGTVDINCPNMTSSICRPTPALHQAAFGDEPRITEMLLQHGARADLLDWADMTAVHTASDRGNTETLKLLLHSLSTPGTVSLLTHTRTL